MLAVYFSNVFFMSLSSCLCLCTLSSSCCFLCCQPCSCTTFSLNAFSILSSYTHKKKIHEDVVEKWSKMCNPWNQVHELTCSCVTSVPIEEPILPFIARPPPPVIVPEGKCTNGHKRESNLKSVCFFFYTSILK